MKSAIWIVTTLSLVARSHAQSISLEQAVQLGLKRSSRLQRYASQVEQALAERDRALTGLAPSFEVVGSGTALDKQQSKAIGPVGFTAANQFEGKLALEASIAVDFSGGTRRQIRQQDIVARAALYQYKAAQNELARDIQVAVYQLRMAREFADIAVSENQNALDRKKVVDQLYVKGVLTKFDTLRAETGVADATQKVATSKNRVVIARANLARLLEVGLAQLPEVTSLPGASWEQSLEETANMAVKLRPDLSAARLAVQAARLGIDLAGQSSRPKVYLGIQSYGLANSGAFEPKQWLSAASLQVRIPIFDRGESRAAAKVAKARVDEAEATAKAAEDSVRFEVVESLALYQDATERLRVAKAVKSQAEEQFRIADQRFRAGITQGGLSPLLELSDSQTALTQAKNNLTSAQVDIEIASTRLRYVVGESVDQEVLK